MTSTDSYGTYYIGFTDSQQFKNPLNYDITVLNRNNSTLPLNDISSGTITRIGNKKESSNTAIFFNNKRFKAINTYYHDNFVMVALKANDSEEIHIIASCNFNRDLILNTNITSDTDANPKKDFTPYIDTIHSIIDDVFIKGTSNKNNITKVILSVNDRDNYTKNESSLRSQGYNQITAVGSNEDCPEFITQIFEHSITRDDNKPTMENNNYNYNSIKVSYKHENNKETGNYKTVKKHQPNIFSKRNFAIAMIVGLVAIVASLYVALSK